MTEFRKALLPISSSHEVWTCGRVWYFHSLGDSSCHYNKFHFLWAELFSFLCSLTRKSHNNDADQHPYQNLIKNKLHILRKHNKTSIIWPIFLILKEGAIMRNPKPRDVKRLQNKRALFINQKSKEKGKVFYFYQDNSLSNSMTIMKKSNLGISVYAGNK